MMKTCTKCNKEYPATPEYFPVRKSRSSGLQSECRKCHRKRAREYYQLNKESCLAMNRKWVRENREKDRRRRRRYQRENYEVLYRKRLERPNFHAQSAYHSSLRRVRLRGQTPDLTDAEINKINLYYTISDYLGSDWSVDHIVPITKGGLHHPDNLQIVHAPENSRKGNRDYKIPNHLVFRI